MTKRSSENNDVAESDDVLTLSNPSRRDLFKKYGPYTAPVVVALLSPQLGYAMNQGAVYSTSAACVADPLGNHGTMTRHCQIDGASPGPSGHVVTNPGPV